ncbi:hypothetical protein [Mycoplasma parvum]|nr:hypothetical protein [Mycoplasma parvum]
MPAVGVGATVSTAGINNVKIKVNNETIEVNPSEFNHLKDSFKNEVGIDFNELKNHSSKKIKVILPCWNGDLLTEYKSKENSVEKNKLKQHLDNFKKAWTSIEQKIKDILNETYGCREVKDLELRVGVIDFGTIQEDINGGMIKGNMKKINVGGGINRNILHNIEFVFNWKREARSTNYKEHRKIIRLYEASIGTNTNKNLNVMVYKILSEAARLTLNKYEWKKLSTNQTSTDSFSAKHSGSERINKDIQKLETGGAGMSAFELSQWCFSNLVKCTSPEKWDDNKLFEFFSSCWRNRVTGGENLLSEFIEQVKKVIKGEKSDKQEKCNLWESGIICSKGGLIYKKEN